MPSNSKYSQDLSVATVRCDLETKREVDYGDPVYRENLRLALLERLQKMDDYDTVSEKTIGKTDWQRLTRYWDLSVPKSMTDQMTSAEKSSVYSAADALSPDEGSSKGSYTVSDATRNHPDYNRLSEEQKRTLAEVVGSVRGWR
ncbi:hypothetical protein BD324DRAFT_647510 [Kockovaella imperatae]|uniref:Uncharacterized protein n=1 Tax=Kockovaella imperatae TaxID=4999 RepID=A0A1Y1UT31_9TREE|nr:hypothetical protein BD324DRAFT_647510 [Kockovaella imperatae]ORX40586.1 hypothetical protein BD324DRAFT_647510 [Kockovaella imperatae]